MLKKLQARSWFVFSQTMQFDGFEIERKYLALPSRAFNNPAGALKSALQYSGVRVGDVYGHEVHIYLQR